MRAYTAPPVRSRPNDWLSRDCSCNRSRRLMAAAACALPVVGLQHPLSFYDAFVGGAS
jgi:hypothetical protein